MMPADDITYTRWDRDIVECGNCGRGNAVDIWNDLRTLRWGFTLDCLYCGEHEEVTNEAGASQVGFVLIICTLAAALIFLLGGWWLASIGALGVLLIIGGATRYAAERKANQ